MPVLWLIINTRCKINLQQNAREDWLCVTIYSSDGTLRPDFPDDANECVLNDETETFVDSIIASSDTNSMLCVLDFFNIFGLKREGKPEPEKKIGISPVREVGNKFIW